MGSEQNEDDPESDVEASSDGMSGDEWPVEDVLARSDSFEDGITRWLVKWENFDEHENTWEPRENLGEDCWNQWLEKNKRISRGEEKPFDLAAFWKRKEKYDADKARQEAIEERNERQRQERILQQELEDDSSSSDEDALPTTKGAHATKVAPETSNAEAASVSDWQDQPAIAKRVPKKSQTRILVTQSPAVQFAYNEVPSGAITVPAEDNNSNRATDMPRTVPSSDPTLTSRPYQGTAVAMKSSRPARRSSINEGERRKPTEFIKGSTTTERLERTKKSASRITARKSSISKMPAPWKANLFAPSKGEKPPPITDLDLRGTRGWLSVTSDTRARERSNELFFPEDDGTGPDNCQRTPDEPPANKDIGGSEVDLARDHAPRPIPERTDSIPPRRPSSTFPSSRPSTAPTHPQPRDLWRGMTQEAILDALEAEWGPYKKKPIRTSEAYRRIASDDVVMKLSFGIEESEIWIGDAVFKRLPRKEEHLWDMFLATRQGGGGAMNIDFRDTCSAEEFQELWSSSVCV